MITLCYQQSARNEKRREVREKRDLARRRKFKLEIKDINEKREKDTGTYNDSNQYYANWDWDGEPVTVP